MTRRAAAVTQADVARAIRAARQAGAAAVEIVRDGDKATIVIRLTPSTGEEKELEPRREVVL